jgi:anaphase-promoting complex subunit 8
VISRVRSSGMDIDPAPPRSVWNAADAVAAAQVPFSNGIERSGCEESVFQQNPEEFRRNVCEQLRVATIEAGRRGLKQSCAWAADLLQSVSSGVHSLSHHSDENAPGKLAGMRGKGSASEGLRGNPNFALSPQSDAILLAKAHFDMAEYQRAAHVLRESTDISKDRLGVFLRLFSLYLAGEKRKEEELMETKDPLQQCQVVNKSLKTIEDELHPVYGSLIDGKASAHGIPEALGDAYLLHLYGVVLTRLRKKEEARTILLVSVRCYPWNWSAWLDLGKVSMDSEVVEHMEQELPPHAMTQFFLGHMFRELQQHMDALDIYGRLEHMFPSSKHVLSEKALVSYHMRDFDESEELFEQLRDKDPYRLDSIDTYSNILYVKEKRSSLSFLAHHAVENNKYCPETCCIIGNYYSLKTQHEKAVLYFRRALKLNPNYLSAWTLMGHEYVEMKNTAAAIEAYRRAVDINPRDYRAWYGLGQVYEMMQMHYYALHYYRKAATLRPYDSRMWTALGQCFDVLERNDSAIDCYERADRHGDREGIAALKLGSLHRKKGDEDEAARYYESYLHAQSELGDIPSDGGVALAETLLFLARYQKARQAYDLAEQYCRRLLDLPSTSEKNDAKSLLRELKALQQTGPSRGPRMSRGHQA